MQDFLNIVWQFCITNQTIVITILSTAFSGFGIVYWQSLREKQKQKQEQQRLQQEARYARDLPFKVIPPNGNVFPKIFKREIEQYSNPVLADQNIPYQQRTEEGDHTEKLEQLIMEHKWLLIRGRSGLGKTREAAELAQRLNREGYYVLVSSGTFDNPTVEQFRNIPQSKVLLVFDDLHNYMNTGWVAEIEKPDTLKSSVNQPPQEKLLQALKHCEQNIITDNMLVLVTTRDEAEAPQTDNVSQKPLPSPLEKLQLKKFPKLYDRFYHYFLPEPTDKAQKLLLESILPETTIEVKCKVEDIVKTNDKTFRNLVENLNRIDNSRNHRYLDENNFVQTLRGTWESAYQKAIHRYPLGKYLYDAVDLLQQCGVIITREIVIETALIIIKGNRWQQRWYSFRLPKILTKLEDLERILNPRDGQIEGKGYSVQVKDFADQLLNLLLGLFAQSPATMEESLSNLSLRLGLRDLQLYQQSLQGYEVLSQYNPDDSTLWLIRGLLLGQLGRYEEAIQSFDQALKIQPEDYNVLDNRGYALFYLGRYEEAIQSFDQAIKIQPDYSTVWCWRGGTLFTLGRYEEAIQSFDQAIKIQPDYFMACFGRGRALFTLGRYEEAIQSFDQALKIQPDYSTVWFERGGALFTLGRYEEAIQSFDQAIKIQADYFMACFGRGRALFTLGRYEEAIQSFDQGLKIQPEDYEVLDKRGFALLYLDRYEEAIQSFDQALKIQPDYFSACFGRGRALFALGRYEEAIQSFDQGLKIQPDYSTVWCGRGGVLFNLGRYEEAIQSFDQAIKIQPDYSTACFARGKALFALGRYEEAIQSFDQAIKIQPDYSTAWYCIACCYALQEKITDAIFNLRQAIKLDSQYLEMAKTDSDFDGIRDDERFLEIVNDNTTN